MVGRLVQTDSLAEDGFVDADGGEFIEALEVEGVEELLGGAVEDRASGGVAATDFADEALFDELAEAIFATDAADLLDFGDGHRLFVSDDSEDFHQGAREFVGDGSEEVGDDVGVFRFGAKLVAASNADKLEGGGVVVFATELFEGVFDLVDRASDGLSQLFGGGR